LSENEEILKLVGNTNGNKVTIRYCLKITTLDLFKANFESQINNTYFFLLLGVISKDGFNHVPRVQKIYLQNGHLKQPARNRQVVRTVKGCQSSTTVIS